MGSGAMMIMASITGNGETKRITMHELRGRWVVDLCRNATVVQVVRN